MFNKLYAENFKSFSSFQSTDIKPLTILCGSNSSGKSSLLQSLLALKQSSESIKSEQSLLFNGRFVQLGSFPDCITNHDSSKAMTLGFKTNISQRDTSIIFVLNNLFDIDNNKSMHNYRYYLDFKYVISAIRKAKKDTLTFPTEVKSILFEVSRISIEDLEEKEESVFKFEANKSQGGNYKLQLSSNCSELLVDDFKSYFKNNTFSYIGKAEFTNFIPHIYTNKRNTPNLSPSASQRLDFIDKINYSLFFHMREGIKDLFSSYKYIGPLREKPSRKYIFNDEVSEIGSKGENAAYIFQEEENKKISKYYLYDYEAQAFTRYIEPSNLSTLTRKVLSNMTINNFSVRTRDNVTGIYLNASTHSNTRVSIADVGFGVSQIFPIVLEGLRMQIGDTLLLEQPEIHLHPNLQMQMADFLIACMLSGKASIVETHSDHIINRIVRRIVEDENLNLNSLIEIYFVQKGSKGPIFEKIEIDSSKGIVNWPKDFFDQTATEQEKIIQAGINKRRKQKNLRSL
jgi:predicted ATPase